MTTAKDDYCHFCVASRMRAMTTMATAATTFTASSNCYKQDNPSPSTYTADDDLCNQWHDNWPQAQAR